MKKIFLAAMLTAGSIFPFAQTPVAVKIDNAELKRILNGIDTVIKYSLKELSVRVFLIPNASGSARQEGSDEVTHNIYIAVSEYDEYPRQSLFVIKDVYNATGFLFADKTKRSGTLSFMFSEPLKKKRRKLTVTISPDKISTKTD